MATLKQQITDVKEQADAERQQRISSGRVHLPQPARSYVSNEATYDDKSSFDSPTVGTNTTFRPNWVTQDAAIQQNKVITTNLPKAVVATGAAVSPVMTSPTLGAVPDMQIAIRVPAQSQVQVSWQVSAALNSTTASATFVLYRDNVKIGTPLYGASSAANNKFSVSQNYIDAPSAGLHSYSVYWSTSAGTLTADSKSRSITGLVLKPQ
jgi:hypothetical protein